MRLDQYLVQEGYFESREKAKEAILQGMVSVDAQPCTKSSFKVINGRQVQVRRPHNEYVSRSGYKLEAAMKHFQVSALGKFCLDVGSSTGGFTQCLLNDSAACVYAVDVGTDQMHPSLTDHERLELHENTDIRDFQIFEGVELDLIVVDVSFISLSKIIPALVKLMQEKTMMLLLFKPQFEVGKDKLKKGIYKDVDIDALIAEFGDFLLEHSLELKGTLKVPLKGKGGNQEYFLKVAAAYSSD